LFLITTSYKPAWSNRSKDILFAGEWCKLYSNKKRWEYLDYKVFPYHWLDRGKLYRDIRDLDSVYEKYLDIITANMNSLHNVQHSKRYWRIIVGPWLNDFIRLLFDYFTIIQGIDNSKLVTSTHIVDAKIEDNIPQNFASFHEAYSMPSYNHFLFGEIIKQTTSIPYETILNLQGDNISGILSSTGKKGFLAKVKRSAKYVLSFLYSSSLIPNKYKKIVFISSYFNNKDLKHIQSRLNQFPMAFLFDPVISPKKVNLELRERLVFKHESSDFERVLNKLIPIQIPVAYIESYKSYGTLANLYFPKKPKTIFTATAFYYNEAFKFWSAKAAENNAKLLIFQHGGGVGTSLWSQEESHMIKSSDLFYVWGWGDCNKNIRNMPANKLTYTKKSILNSNPQGDILCVTNADIINYLHTQYPMPVEKHFLDFTNDVISIHGSLNNEPRKYFRYRLYHTNYNRTTWGVEYKFTESGLGKLVDKRGVSFHDRVNNCRLAIIVYGQNTTMYETLSANFPTMLFWNPDHWELREEAKPYFDLLEQSGVYHTNVHSLCEKINEVYENVDKWWQSESTQKAVKTFCEKYAFTGEDHIADWVRELENHT
jgi:putative transferase (TIGR04331 family)